MRYTLTREHWAARYDRLGLRWPGQVEVDADFNFYVTLWLDAGHKELWRYVDETDSYEMLWPQLST